MSTSSLFSLGPRTDTGAAPYQASAYETLDQHHGQSAARLRAELDRWWRDLPELAAAQIRERFRQRAFGDYLGAFFELYLHRLFSQLGHAVDIDVGNDRDETRRPDFLLDEALWVEATAVVGADVIAPADAALQDALYDAANAVDAPAWIGSLEVIKTGTRTPGARSVTRPIERWLRSLDPDADSQADAEHGPLPLRFDDWEVDVYAHSLRPEHRDDPHHRFIGSRFSGVSFIDDISPLRQRVRRKATHYGDLEFPYVVAVLCAGTFVKDDDIEQALIGRRGLRYVIGNQSAGMRWVRTPDGALYHEGRPINTRVSAVLTWTQLSPRAITVVEPTLWLNPWASRPLSTDWPWRTMTLSRTGGPTTELRQHSKTCCAILGLPARWPEVDS